MAGNGHKTVAHDRGQLYRFLLSVYRSDHQQVAASARRASADVLLADQQDIVNIFEYCVLGVFVTLRGDLRRTDVGSNDGMVALNYLDIILVGLERQIRLVRHISLIDRLYGRVSDLIRCVFAAPLYQKSLAGTRGHDPDEHDHEHERYAGHHVSPPGNTREETRDAALSFGLVIVPCVISASGRFKTFLRLRGRDIGHHDHGILYFGVDLLNNGIADRLDHLHVSFLILHFGEIFGKIIDLLFDHGSRLGLHSFHRLCGRGSVLRYFLSLMFGLGRCGRIAHRRREILELTAVDLYVVFFFLRYSVGFYLDQLIGVIVLVHQFPSVWTAGQGSSGSRNINR